MKTKTMKKLTRIIRCFLLFMTIMVTAGSMNAEAAAPKLNAKSKTIYLGHSYRLKVKNTKKKVKWSSSNKSIATVSSNGVVKGKKIGNVTITAKVAKKKLTCKITVKNNIYATKTDITLKNGKSTKVTVSVKKDINSIWYQIKDKDIVSCKWGDWKGKKLPLTITAKKPGKTTVTITDKSTKEKVKIQVIVPKFGDDIEVIIPDTIGEQGNETNRMKILDYSFYKENWLDVYYMNIKFQMVEYGNTRRSNWGEDVYFYDADGNILGKKMLYANSLALNKQFTYDFTIPENTAKIEFMEYPSMESKPDNGNTNGGTGDDDNSVKNDPTKWSLSDLKKVQEYIETAYKWTSYAKDYFSDNKLMESAQTVMAIKALKTAKEWTQSAYDYAVKKETFTYKAGDSSKTLQGELQALLSLFDGVENWTTDDHRTVQQTSLNINTSMSMFRYVISRLILEVM